MDLFRTPSFVGVTCIEPTKDSVRNISIFRYLEHRCRWTFGVEGAKFALTQNVHVIFPKFTHNFPKFPQNFRNLADRGIQIPGFYLCVCECGGDRWWGGGRRTCKCNSSLTLISV